MLTQCYHTVSVPYSAGYCLHVNASPDIIYYRRHLLYQLKIMIDASFFILMTGSTNACYSYISNAVPCVVGRITDWVIHPEMADIKKNNWDAAGEDNVSLLIRFSLQNLSSVSPTDTISLKLCTF